MSRSRFSKGPLIAGAMVLSASLLAGSTATGAPGARSKYVVVPAHDVKATPDDLDVIAFERHWYGGKKPKTPKAVVVLVPGFFGGSETFRYAAQRLVTRDASLQVWAVDRRNNMLENRCDMEEAEKAGTLSRVMLAAAYYIQAVNLYDTCPSPDDPEPEVWNGIDEEYFLSQEEAGSLGMADWGLATTLKDIRVLIRRAHKRYPTAKVVLGGHSLGGMTTQAYAGWRFGSKPRSAGWRHLDGIVLIDGSLDGTRWESQLLQQHFDREEELEQGIYYWERPEAGYLLGYLAELGGMASAFAPEQESFLWAGLEGTPLQWPDPASCPTNKAVFAALTDDEMAFSPTFEMQQGSLSVPVDLNSDGSDDRCGGIHSDRLLAHWADFDETDPPELSSTDRWAASTFAGRDTNVAEWFFSIALNSDLDLGHNLDSRAPYVDAQGIETTASESKGLRIFDTARVKLPAFGFVTSNCMERYEWYGEVAAGLTSYKLIDRSGPNCDVPAVEAWSHLDPLYAEDEGEFSNDFVVELIKWLRKEVL